MDTEIDSGDTTSEIDPTSDQKFLFVVKHYVPRPHSEGGRWVVIAESDEECFNLITADDDGDFYARYYPTIWDNLRRANVFYLAKDEDVNCCSPHYTTKESRIVEKFIT